MADNQVIVGGPEEMLAVHVNGKYYLVPEPERFRRDVITPEVFHTLRAAHKKAVGEAVIVIVTLESDSG